jgi:hypothetical protein
MLRGSVNPSYPTSNHVTLSDTQTLLSKNRKGHGLKFWAENRLPRRMSYVIFFTLSRRIPIRLEAPQDQLLQNPCPLKYDSIASYFITSTEP